VIESDGREGGVIVATRQWSAKVVVYCCWLYARGAFAFTESCKVVESVCAGRLVQDVVASTSLVQCGLRARRSKRWSVYSAAHGSTQRLNAMRPGSRPSRSVASCMRRSVRVQAGVDVGVELEERGRQGGRAKEDRLRRA
jgi:hypothetical protein